MTCYFDFWGKSLGTFSLDYHNYKTFGAFHTRAVWLKRTLVRFVCGMNLIRPQSNPNAVSIPPCLTKPAPVACRQHVVQETMPPRSFKGAILLDYLCLISGQNDWGDANSAGPFWLTWHFPAENKFSSLHWSVTTEWTTALMWFFVDRFWFTWHFACVIQTRTNKQQVWKHIKQIYISSGAFTPASFSLVEWHQSSSYPLVWFVWAAVKTEITLRCTTKAEWTTGPRQKRFGSFKDQPGSNWMQEELHLFGVSRPHSQRRIKIKIFLTTSYRWHLIKCWRRSQVLIRPNQYQYNENNRSREDLHDCSACFHLSRPASASYCLSNQWMTSAHLFFVLQTLVHLQKGEWKWTAPNKNNHLCIWSKPKQENWQTFLRR